MFFSTTPNNQLQIFKNKNKSLNRNGTALMFSHVFTFLKMYIFWVGLHYATVQLYVYACVSSSFLGLLMAPLTASSPHCHAIRWALYESGYNTSLLGMTALTMTAKVLLLTT